MLLDLKIPKGEKWSGDCRVNSLFMFLRYYGITNLSKPQILTLGNGINFTYAKVGYKQYSCFTSTDPEIESRVLNTLNFDYAKETITGEMEGILKLHSLIDHGSPVLMKVNADALTPEYILQKKLRDSNGQKSPMGVTGTPMMFGHQGIPETAVLFWTNNFHKPEPVEMIWDKLNYYRSTEILPASPQNACYYCKKEPSAANIPDTPKLQYIVDRNINDIISRAVECRNNIIGSTIEEKTGTPPKYGIEAVKALCDAMTDYSDNYLQNRDKPIEVKYSIEYLAYTAEILEKGSDTAYRQEMSEMLELHSNAYVRVMGIAMKQVAKDWRTMIINAKKLAKAEEPIVNLKNIKRAAKNIERREIFIYSSIYKVLNLNVNKG